ncbi:hypothetical protein PFICI_14642 [Pestalotiopsis fici W106-1]|uniref:NB-ARC domain-containing protein n=1 Tax=Pestalotiopsis fici (strain W106-1 / CGMCC3.15140) TaxID=1229662 RepID=W3WLK0_PESFW|nr:uncharacterized protein PFICI_14642 [Pestalotiopsis fici W106-1]ETS73696.1 hypothetical protein PFICI_14642 [Pestalotiopsis fici W106-1]
MPLRQLFDPSSATTSGKAKVDLIAVHGLNPRSKKDADHAFDTWRTPAGETGRLWLRDDLPCVLPDTRICLYEYNATAVYGKDRDTFVGKANELLEAIRIERDEDEDRPIIFLGHSMGGLLIKQALINAHNNPKYTSIKSATSGLVFFATPHNGGDWKLVSLGGVAAKIATRSGFQKGDDVIEVLKKGSMFSDIMEEQWRHQLLMYDIVSFWGSEDDIVPRESARFGLPGDRENVVKLNADHGSVCRFGLGQTDLDNLKLVRGNIRDVYRNALKTRASPPGESGEIHRRHHYIPLTQNRKFTGRTQVLERLQEKLFIEPDCQKLVVQGLGGVGKTQVALQYAFWVKEHQPDYSVLWVPAYSRTGFDQAYMEIARRLGIQATGKDQDARELVRRRLESEDSGKWFLVVDNVDDVDILYGQAGSNSNPNSDAASEDGIHQYLPESQNCVLLFTTRSPDVAVEIAGPDVIDLEEMSSEEAVGLLTTLLRRQELLRDKTIVAKLLQELAYLPLAIAQAAAYLNRNRQSSISSYLKLLHGTEEDIIGLLSREFRDGSLFQASQRAVATTWMVSFDLISVSDDAAIKLLSFISCIEPKSIPLSLLPQNKSAEERQHAIGTLCGYAFLVAREDEEMFDMHRLVHMATRIWNQRHDRIKEVTLGALHQLNAVFPPIDTANWERWRVYLPHAVRALGESKGHCVQERYDLLNRVSPYFFEERRFKEVLPALDEAASWRRNAMPDTNPDRLTTEHWLANAYLENRRINEAIVLLEHVVALREHMLDERDRSRLLSQYQLARAYLASRRIKEAIVIFEHVVAVREKTLDERDHKRLDSQHELARAYLEDRRIKEAIVIFEHVVAVRDQMLDERSQHRQGSQHMLARAYLDDKRAAEAVVILEHVVAVQRQTLDETDLFRLASEHVLARAYLNNRRIKEAIVMFEYVVEGFKQALEEKDIYRLKSQRELARAYLDDGRIKEAVVMLEYVVAAFEQTLDRRDFDRLVTEHVLARAYLADGEVQKAVALLEHVVAMKAETLAPNDDSRLLSVALLADARKAL